ncbi:hypothetical protein Zmor_006122 [Zophobas morio]|uniref:MADF domain-containing protein n=1 Tax=Zophobas morio TaxID=2755281 RepID=A0AA38IT56_9CUCU|nr:hypothetical protein Zmor_006122 [Zophobas morio]
MSWSRQQCETLIEEYQKYACLYAVKSPQYKNKHARQSALEKIQEQLEPLRANVTLAEIKAKISEFRKWNASKHSAAGEDSVSIFILRLNVGSIKILLQTYVPTICSDSLTWSDRSDKENNSMPQTNMMESETGEHSTEEDVHAEDYVVSPTGVLEVDDGSLAPGVSSDSTTPQAKKLKVRHRATPDCNIMKEASKALTAISNSINKKAAVAVTAQTVANETLAQFIVTKLEQITDYDIRLEAEEAITSKLYECIKKCRNIDLNKQ